MTTSRIVATQEELDAALSEGAEHIVIDSPAGVWLTVNASSYVEEVRGRAVVNGGRVGRVVNGGRVGWVDNGGRVDWVDNGGRVGRVDNGGRVDWVDNGGRVGRVDNGGSVGRVDNGGSVGRVDNGGRVGRAIKASSVHLYGGTLTHAAPTVAVFVHTADSTWSGGTLIDLRELDLTDVDTWRTWTDAHVDPTLDQLTVTNVSSEGHEGTLHKSGQIIIGCFVGTVSELRALVEGDKWPSGADEEKRGRYRPRLLAFADLCEQQLATWTAVSDA